MLENIIQTLRELEGVHSVVLADATGQVLAHRGHNMYDKDLLQQVGRFVATAVDSVKLIHEEWESISADFAEGKLLIRNLVPAANGPTYTLTLVADGRLNASFATVAIRVALGKLKSAILAGAGTALSSSSMQMSASALTPQPISNNAAHASALSMSAIPSASAMSGSGKASVTEVASSGLSWSGLNSSGGSSASGVEVTDAESSAVLTACTKALARHVGPMAKLFVKEAVRKLWQGRPFSKEGTPDLIAELSKQIESSADAAAFRSALGKLK